MKVKERKTQQVYDCIVQAVDLNFDGRYVLRYNIGIRNYQGFHSHCCVYDNNEFNEQYEVIESEVSAMPVAAEKVDVKVIIEDGVVETVLKDQDVPIRVEVIDVNKDYSDYNDLRKYREKLLNDRSFTNCEHAVVIPNSG